MLALPALLGQRMHTVTKPSHGAALQRSQSQVTVPVGGGRDAQSWNHRWRYDTAAVGARSNCSSAQCDYIH